MTLKELKTAYNVLSELDYNVPKELLIFLSHEIRDKETCMATRKMRKMTEEQLIVYSNKQRNILRVNCYDGRLIQKKTSERTFRTALLEVDLSKVVPLNILVRRKQVVISDPTLKRQRIKGYVMLKPGYFVIAKSTSEEKARILEKIDESLQLNWEIELL